MSRLSEFDINCSNKKVRSIFAYETNIANQSNNIKRH